MGRIQRPKPQVQILHHGGDSLISDGGRYERHWDDDRCCSEIEFEMPLLVMRSLVAIAGILLLFSVFYSLYPITSTIANIPLCALKFYAAFFGLTILLLEGKGALPEHSSLRKWFYTEFHFLHSIRGKGFYYLLVGMLSLSLISENMAFLVCGVLITGMGILNLTFSALTNKQLVQRGLSLKDLQTTTKVSRPSHSHHHRHEKKKPDKLVDTETQQLLNDDRLVGMQNFTQPLKFDSVVPNFSITRNNEQLPEFEMTSYADPLRMHFGR